MQLGFGLGLGATNSTGSAPLLTAPGGGMYPGNTVTSNKPGQWYVNGVAISGQTANSLVIPYTVNPGDLVTQAGSAALTVAGYDTDAATYITAVLAASSDLGTTAANRANNKWRIHELVVGWKADASQVGGLSNWAALSDVILCVGPTTVAGALVPLKGATTFTNVNFVNGDLNRLTGLKGDASTKAIASSRLGSSLSVSDFHMCVDAGEMEVAGTFGFAGTRNGSATTDPHLYIFEVAGTRMGIGAQAYTGNTVTATNSADAMECIVSISATDFKYFRNGTQQATLATSRSSLASGSLELFCISSGASTSKTRGNYSAMRLRLYSVGRAITPSTFYARWNTYKAAVQ